MSKMEGLCPEHTVDFNDTWTTINSHWTKVTLSVRSAHSASASAPKCQVPGTSEFVVPAREMKYGVTTSPLSSSPQSAMGATSTDLQFEVVRLHHGLQALSLSNEKTKGKSPSPITEW